jgi:hypothetical protein
MQIHEILFNKLKYVYNWRGKVIEYNWKLRKGSLGSQTLIYTFNKLVSPSPPNNFANTPTNIWLPICATFRFSNPNFRAWFLSFASLPLCKNFCRAFYWAFRPNYFQFFQECRPIFNFSIHYNLRIFLLNLEFCDMKVVLRIFYFYFFVYLELKFSFPFLFLLIQA